MTARTPDQDEDGRYMAAAIRYARRHLARTSANPSVACLIVRDGVIVGRGITAKGGRPHAEAIAIKEAGTRATGATAYVTLEPCAHHGKTPPCANALVTAKIARVVVAAADPDDRVSGKGNAILRAGGIHVTEDMLRAKAERDLAVISAGRSIKDRSSHLNLRSVPMVCSAKKVRGK